MAVTPFWGLLLTLVAWIAANALSRRLHHPAWAAPSVVSIVAVGAVLLASGTPYAAYFEGARFLHLLLGPATVALAVPLYANLGTVRRSAGALGPALLAGTAATIAAAVLLAHALGAPRAIVLALSVKSVTSPIALGIAAKIGASPGLATGFVMLSGMLGVLLSGPVLRLARIRDPRARGLAAGTVAHGLATAHMLVRSEVAGLFAGLALSLNGVLSSVLVPLLLRLFRLG